MSTKLGSVVAALGGELLGDPQLPVHRLAPLTTATASDLAFVAQARYAHQIESTLAAGYAVSETRDGLSALALQTEAPCDVLVLDLMMPGLDGLELCKTLRGRAAPVS